MKVLDSDIKIKSKNVINDDNSTVDETLKNIKDNITKLIPIELYKTSSGSSGTITLNDNTSKYKYLEIFYGADTIEYSVKVRSGENFTTGCQAVRSDGGINMYTSNWSMNGTSISFQSASNRYIGNDNAIHSYGTNAYTKIFEVIGYKEV